MDAIDRLLTRHLSPIRVNPRLKIGFGQKLRWSPRFCRLFESVSDPDQLWFAVGAAKERDPNRHPKHVTRGNGDVWISRHCRRRRITAREVIAIDPVSRPR